MALERTFSILKPDATERNLTGAINAMIEKAGLRIVGQKRVRITKEQAQRFYGVHKERPFFGELVDFILCGMSRMVRTFAVTFSPSAPSPRVAAMASVPSS